jgi:hypothetical protein
MSATPNTVRVLSPAGTGTVNVTVTVDGVTSVKSRADLFTYLWCRWW